MTTASTDRLVERLRGVAVQPAHGWLGQVADRLEELEARTPTPRRVDLAAQVMADGLDAIALELAAGVNREDFKRDGLRSLAFAVEAAAHAHDELDDWDRWRERDAAFVAAFLSPVSAIETATRGLEAGQFARQTLREEDVARLREIFAGVTNLRRRLDELAKHYDGPIDDEGDR